MNRLFLPRIKPIIFFILFISVAGFPQEKNKVFQYSVISALMEGNYDGDLSFDELRKYGDFGLGTVNQLNGEVVAVDGKFYQITSEGKVHGVHGKMQTPFAVVTFFDPDSSVLLDSSLSLSEVTKLIDSMIESPNYVYAVKISGNFRYVKTRSVAKQEKPYKKLVEVTKNQSVFELNDTKGVIAGFRFPAYTEGVNVPGYHFHFISGNYSSGGHVLAMDIANVTIEIAKQDELKIDFPGNEDFMNVDLSKSSSEDLKKAEK